MTGFRLWTALLSTSVLFVLGACALTPPTMPIYPVQKQSVWLDQGWRPAERDWFHHADQGTLTFSIPYQWFVALEQPDLLGQAPPLSDQTYLDRFGFIPGKGVLPVGIAAGGDFRDPARERALYNPATGKPYNGIGMTCAACHTGRMTFRNTEILIDGGSALTNLGATRRAIGLALAFTDLNPLRFNRFADRVLGAAATDQAKEALRAQLKSVLADGKKELALINATKAASVEEGFGRLDAINRIGNQVFSIDMGIDANYAPLTAPVNFPHIWTAPWFTWVQYNGSIMQPLVRNAGEAMGVKALVNFTNAERPLYDSTIQFRELDRIEQSLAGPPPFPGRRFSGLSSPKWPSILPEIVPERAAAGAKLYQELCQGCHLPAPDTAAFWTGKWWTQIGGKGERYLDLHQIPVAAIGTDEAMALGMARRTITLRDNVRLKSTMFGPALGELVERAATRWYDEQKPGISKTGRDQMNGSRPNRLQVPLEYKARPLNGIWAAPPYLHNGSVPNIFSLLSPVSARPAKVFLGNREFDPVNVGYRNEPIPGGFTLDTSLPGNRNTGHEFRDGPRSGGVIGRGLNDAERLAIIEYLKTL